MFVTPLKRLFKYSNCFICEDGVFVQHRWYFTLAKWLFHYITMGDFKTIYKIKIAKVDINDNHMLKMKIKEE